jgi:phosphatidylglycerol:prolipoprotein diacylglycerol transferase
MQQVLFHVGPLPIFGYGMMLFAAFVACIYLAGWLCRQEVVDPGTVADMALWIFLCGIVGARITFFIQYQLWDGLSLGQALVQFVKIWEGGLVFYGSAVGGLVGYCLAYFFILRKRQVSSWKMADVIAPCVALGLAIGRIGCLLNGCCFGAVACSDCPGWGFPLSAPPRYHLVARGYQTAAGFTMSETAREGMAVVGSVEPDSAAERAGLRSGDVIVKADGKEIASYLELFTYLANQNDWPRGKNDLQLTVKRPGNAAEQDLTLPVFYPTTLRLHPTQVYETISMLLLLAVMLAYRPFRRRDGELLVLFMFAYAVHRFLDEMLRDDTAPVFGTGLTLSENGSVLLLVAGVVVLLFLLRRPVQYRLLARQGGPGVPPLAAPSGVAASSP